MDKATEGHGKHGNLPRIDTERHGKLATEGHGIKREFVEDIAQG